MSDDKKAPEPTTEQPAPRRIILSSGQAWLLKERVDQEGLARRAVDQAMQTILDKAGVENGDAKWLLEIGEEIALVEQVADE